MNNVLYEELPQEWNGYPINWWFQVGIQIYLASEDKELTDFERAEIICDLLFPASVPPAGEINECLSWFLGGWNHDRSPAEAEKRKLMDFYKDQWRIYADFRHVYGINLNEADLHWWEFMGMLWNMPEKDSSFLQVINIRKKKIKSKMSKEEKAAIKKAQYIYGLDDTGQKQKREYSEDELKKMDDVDALRERMKQKKSAKAEIIAAFREQ